MCEYEYECKYLIITWVRVRVWVLVDEYEYKYEYRSMIYILYWQQFCIVQSLTRESLDSSKPGTKLQLPIVHVNLQLVAILKTESKNIVKCVENSVFFFNKSEVKIFIY